MTKSRIFLLFIFLLHLFSNAQQDLLKRGAALFIQDIYLNEFTGTIGTFNDSIVYIIKNPKDSIRLNRKEILKITLITENNYLNGKQISKDEFYPFQSTFQTAFPLNKKTFYYSNSNLLFNSAYLGITNKFSMAINSTILLAPIGLSLKYSLQLNDHFYISPEVGFGSGSWPLSKLRTFHFALRASQGNQLKNISAGAGYFKMDGFRSYFKRVSIGDSIDIAYVNFGFKQRFSSKFTLDADFWYFNTRSIVIRNNIILKPQFFFTGLFIRYHNLPDRQWRFGSMFLIFNNSKRGWLTIPIPTVQWNYVLSD